jgi:hypothetical protein
LDSIPPVTQFSVARIPPSLASIGPTYTATSEQEQATPTAMTPHAGGKMLDYSIRGPLTLSYQLGSMVGLAKEVPSSKHLFIMKLPEAGKRIVSYNKTAKLASLMNNRV